MSSPTSSRSSMASWPTTLLPTSSTIAAVTEASGFGTGRVVIVQPSRQPSSLDPLSPILVLEDPGRELGRSDRTVRFQSSPVRSAV